MAYVTPPDGASKDLSIMGLAGLGRGLAQASGSAMSTLEKRPVPTLEWLQDKLVGLLENAMEGDAPDHAACAKYCDLLYKLLPKGGRQNVDPAITAAVTAALDLEATP